MPGGYGPIKLVLIGWHTSCPNLLQGPCGKIPAEKCKKFNFLHLTHQPWSNHEPLKPLVNSSTGSPAPPPGSPNYDYRVEHLSESTLFNLVSRLAGGRLDFGAVGWEMKMAQNAHMTLRICNTHTEVSRDGIHITDASAEKAVLKLFIILHCGNEIPNETLEKFK